LAVAEPRGSIRAYRSDDLEPVVDANAVGRRFYERYGFVETERKVHESTGLEVMRLALTWAKP
jgi:hypothetical protein